MNRIISLVLVPLLFAVLAARAADSGEIRVEITGLQNATGNVYITVYDSEDNWLGKNTVLQKTVVIAEALQGDIVFALLQLPQGEYGLSLYFDEDNDGTMDTNFIGIPKEPVAMSNNAKGKFGPPKWEDAKFTLGAEPVVQRMSMEDI